MTAGVVLKSQFASRALPTELGPSNVAPDRNERRIRRHDDGHSAASHPTVTLKQLGLTKQDLHQWRQLGAIPAAAFEEIVAAFCAEGVPPTRSRVLRVWGQQGRRRPAPDRLERMAAELRKASWTVLPPAHVDRDQARWEVLSPKKRGPRTQ